MTKRLKKDYFHPYIRSGKDQDMLESKWINDEIGRGVFAQRVFEKDEFLLEYRGKVLERKPEEKIPDDYLYEFRSLDGKKNWIDASVEDGSLGRLVNDDHKNPNTTMKTIVVDGSPRLCLFARRKILTFEEIRYDYGVGNYPWRVKGGLE